MKRYFLVISTLLILPLSISVFAQTAKGDTTITKKAKVKKSKKSKKTKVVEITKASDINLVVAKTVIDEPDTPIFRLNLIDTTTSVFKGNQTRVVYKKNCDECFRINYIERDTSTSEKYAKRKYIFTAQYIALEFDVQGFRDYQKATANEEPEIIQLKKEILERQEKIKVIQSNSQKNKQ